MDLTGWTMTVFPELGLGPGYVIVRFRHECGTILEHSHSPLVTSHPDTRCICPFDRLLDHIC